MKYFILYKNMEIIRHYIKTHDINIDDITVCSELNTLNYDNVVQALIEANIRLIMPDFADNRQAKDIVAKVLEIMVENAIHTNNLFAYAIKHKLI